MKVSIPVSGSPTALREQAVSRATAAGVAKTSTLSWISFIPQKKIDAPTGGCDYGKKFQFGGDGRSKFDWKSSKYRTALHATVTWKSKKVVSNKHIGATTVYVKKTGKKVRHRCPRRGCGSSAGPSQRGSVRPARSWLPRAELTLERFAEHRAPTPFVPGVRARA
ncbi:hypothetical protein ACFYSH_33825 [Streptomyces sp. NPDC005791]|uniref:hypothetical protein n=1 Tax=Streptomyces sp. NPDC005791 TaxID=3364732 RepID=UPI0036A94D2A